MIFLIPSTHGILTGFFALILTACVFFISVKSLSVSQPQLQQNANNIYPINPSNRDRRAVNEYIYGQYHECNAFGRYTNCVCVGCKGEGHKAAEAERGDTIHCCYHLIDRVIAANIVKISVKRATYDTYTEGFESSFKNAVMESLLYFCQDEEHQDRCRDFKVNSLVAGDLHVTRLVTRFSYGTYVLLFQFVIFARENSNAQSTGRKRRFSFNSATNDTSNNDKVKRHAPFSDKIASPVSMADDLSALRRNHIRRKRSVVRKTVPGNVLIDTIKAYDETIEEQLGYSIQVEAGDQEISTIEKSGWKGMSETAKTFVIWLMVIGGILAAVVGSVVFTKVAK